MIFVSGYVIQLDIPYISPRLYVTISRLSVGRHQLMTTRWIMFCYKFCWIVSFLILCDLYDLVFHIYDAYLSTSSSSSSVICYICICSSLSKVFIFLRNVCVKIYCYWIFWHIGSQEPCELLSSLYVRRCRRMSTFYKNHWVK